MLVSLEFSPSFIIEINNHFDINRFVGDAECKININDELMSIITHLYSVVLSYMNHINLAINRPKELFDIQLYGSVIHHIFAAEMGQDVPYNDFDFMVILSKPVTKEFIQFCQISSTVNLDFVGEFSICKSSDYEKLFVKCEKVINEKTYKFDISLGDKNTILDGLPITTACMKFTTFKPPYIYCPNDFQIINIIEMFEKKPLTYPMVRILASSLIRDKKYKDDFIIKCIIAAKKMKNGINILGFHFGKCTICQEEGETENEQILRSCLFEFCSSSMHGVCIICTILQLSSFKASCDQCRADYCEHLEYDDKNILERFLKLPFAWSYIKAIHCETVRRKSFHSRELLLLALREERKVTSPHND